METCGLTRILVPAAVVGVIVSTLTHSDAVGWVAAIATAVALGVWMRVRGVTGACTDTARRDTADTPQALFTVDELIGEDTGAPARR